MTASQVNASATLYYDFGSSTLAAAGFRAIVPETKGRSLCCGRTFLAAGLVEEACAEARRFIDAVRPFVERGILARRAASELGRDEAETAAADRAGQAGW